ncbi:hypothetical protein HPG69_013922, partial [Diceros bicornis minor]
WRPWEAAPGPQPPLLFSALEPTPQPSIWADPGPMVSTGSPVTMWCQGSQQAEVYRSYKERVSKPLDIEAPRTPETRQVSPLNLVYHAPSNSVHQGPVAASGENVSISCSSEFTLDAFHLLKVGGADPTRHMELTIRPGRRQAVFPVGPGALPLSPAKLAGAIWRQSDPLASSPAADTEEETLCDRRGGAALGDAAGKDTWPEEEFEVDHQQDSQDEDSQGVMYSEVNHSRSRPRWRVATSPSPMSEE